MIANNASSSTSNTAKPMILAGGDEVRDRAEGIDCICWEAELRQSREEQTKPVAKASTRAGGDFTLGNALAQSTDHQCAASAEHAHAQ